MQKRIAVVTSGGDAPGMNAAVRGVVRAAAEKGWETLGVMRGYEGLIAGQTRALGCRDVGGIIQNGGSILGSARSHAFLEAAGRRQALAQLEKEGVWALVVIGGNGSQQGSAALSREGFPVIGLGSTIDNDLAGAEPSLGVDTALNVALEALDRLKTTASSLRRVFLLEVMGRKCGYIALAAGIAGGAEAVVLPEVDTDPAKLAAELRAAYDRGKPHGIVVVAEGAKMNAQALARYFEQNSHLGFEVRATILGHVQRGARPTAFDRMLGTRLGGAAVDHLARGEHGLLLGMTRGRLEPVALEAIAGKTKTLDPELLTLAATMSL